MIDTGISPLPREPLSAIADGNGNVSIKYRAPVHFYAMVYIPISISYGKPTWTVQLSDNLPLVFGAGQQTQMGPILLQPGEIVTIKAVGGAAAAGSAVIGQILGFQALAPEPLLGALPVQSVSVYVPQPQFGTVAPFDATSLGAASLTQFAGPGAGYVLDLKKISLSSNVAVQNKVQLWAVGSSSPWFSIILPANSQPYIYEWPTDTGEQMSQALKFYTDNAGLFSFSVTYRVAPIGAP